MGPPLWHKVLMYTGFCKVKNLSEVRLDILKIKISGNYLSDFFARTVYYLINLIQTYYDDTIIYRITV